MALAKEYRLDLEGYLVGQGALHTIGDLTVPQMMAYVWWFFTKEIDEKERTQFKARLWLPPPEERGKPIPARSPWSAENEMAAFAALRAETGQG